MWIVIAVVATLAALLWASAFTALLFAPGSVRRDR